MLQKLGADCLELRQKADITDDLDGLVLPGGESTVQGKLLHQLDMFDTLQKKIKGGLPVLATCAGLILLAEKLSNDEHTYFATLPVTVQRNAYGRQLGSFSVELEYKRLGKIPMTFIRAPYIEETADGVDVTATADGRIVGVQYKNQIGLAFHPEMDKDPSIHKLFLSLIRNN